MNKQRGITIISLIITIVIMLILAGVVLNLTIGERGIFKTAKRAAQNYTDAQNEELENIDNLINTLDKTITNNSNTIDNNSNQNTNESTEILKLQQEIQELKKEINSMQTTITTLNSIVYPTEYIKPTVESSGIGITRGGYFKVGNIVCVNMVVTIDTSKFSLTSDLNNPAQILRGLPKSDMGDCVLVGRYPTRNSVEGYTAQGIRVTVDLNGNLKLAQTADYPYRTNNGIEIMGCYLSSEL